MHTLEPLAATPAPIADLDRLGDEIAELSAHLQAATAPARSHPCVRRARGLGWLGEPLDVVWAIDVLHPLAGRRRR
jgi:hypothetical protein